MIDSETVLGDLTPEDRAQVAELEQQTRARFAAGHTVTRYSMIADDASRSISQRAWAEFVRRAPMAGWDAAFHGSDVRVWPRRPADA